MAAYAVYLMMGMIATYQIGLLILAVVLCAFAFFKKRGEVSPENKAWQIGLGLMLGWAGYIFLQILKKSPM